MPIGSITSQPSANSLNAAYRPILLTVTATATGGGVPPVVYCDIYFNGIYYKTFSKTQYSTPTTWIFDAQDAAQEYLEKFLEDNGQSLVLDVTGVLAKMQCKFRSSGLDTEGLLVPEGTAPIQGTLDEEPVAGDGTASNEFYVLNATLQHEDNQDLAQHLAAYRYGTWAAGTYPLSHRPNRYKMCVDNSDSFPIVSDDTPVQLVLHHTLRNGTTGSSGADLPCIAATWASTPALPNATENNAYSQSLSLNGTGPFAINTIVKPSWMTVSLSGNTISFTGTPLTADIGTDIAVSFNITNCTSDVLAFSDSIDVVEETPCVPVNTSGSVTIPNAEVGTPYFVSIPLVGTAPFTLSGINKPAWMTIALVGANIQFTGTPSNSDQGTNKTVDVTINGCNSSSVRIFNVITVMPEGQHAYVINDTGFPLTVITNLGTYNFADSGPGRNDDIAFTTGAITIQVMTGTHTVEAIQSMPTPIQSFPGTVQGDVINLSDIANTNYLWFKV